MEHSNISKKSIPSLYIEGDRLRLSPFNLENITDEYISWLNNPEVVRFSNQRFTVHTKDSCKKYFDSFEGTTNQFLAIEDKSCNEMVGTLTVYFNHHHQTADVGILFGAVNKWGQGYGLEAFSLIIKTLSSIHAVRKITAGALACNVGMVKLMERSGLKLEAVRSGQELVDGRPEDILYFSYFNHV